MVSIPFAGVTPNTLVDYPGKVATLVAVAGCNLRCPYCHNFNSCLKVEEPKNADEIMEQLKNYARFVEAIVVSGGEPMMYDELPIFIVALKALGKLIKIDTNGTYPNVLRKALLTSVDFVAMDIKYPLKKYRYYSEDVSKSIDLIRTHMSVGDYHFRTTVHKEFLPEKELKDIIKILKPNDTWKIQKVRQSDGMEDATIFSDDTNYSLKEISVFMKMAEDKGILVEVNW